MARQSNAAHCVSLLSCYESVLRTWILCSDSASRAPSHCSSEQLSGTVTSCCVSDHMSVALLL